MPQHGKSEMFDMLVANARSFIHTEVNTDRIIQAMASGDPAFVVGQQAAIILTQIVESAGRSGAPPKAEEAMAAAAVVIEEILDIVMAGGVLPEGTVQDEEFLKSAMMSFKETVDSQSDQPPTQEAVAGGEMAQGVQNV